MTSRHKAVHRQDSTAKSLVQEARDYGAIVVLIDDVFDAVMSFRGRVYVVDFKGEKTKLTKRQSALLAQGFPIFFIRTSEQLRDLLFGKAA